MATDVTVAWSVRLYVCMLSVTLMHPAKAAGRNEMPFGSGTRMVPSSIVLGRGLRPPQEEKIWGSEPPASSNAAYRQITLAVVNVSISIRIVISTDTKHYYRGPSKNI